jgi:hydrogenase/urease accessory protein HupE
MSLISNIVKFAPKVEDAVLGFLPASVANTVRGARKAIYSVATASVGVLAGLGELPLPAPVSAIVAAASVVATGIVTYWAPNA